MLTLQASLDSKTKALRRAEQAAQQRAEHAQHELAVARRECDRSAGDAEDRKVQLSVLVETVETLQAGTPGKTHAAIPFFCKRKQTLCGKTKMLTFNIRCCWLL